MFQQSQRQKGTGASIRRRLNLEINSATETGDEGGSNQLRPAVKESLVLDLFTGEILKYQYFSSAIMS